MMEGESKEKHKNNNKKYSCKTCGKKFTNKTKGGGDLLQVSVTSDFLVLLIIGS